MYRLHRRRLLGIAATLLAIVSTGDASSLPTMTPPEIAARVNWSPQCTAFQIVGTCLCHGIPCGWHVTQYIPVAFGETTRTPGESLVASLDPSALTVALATEISAHTRSISQSGLDNTYEAHVWLLPEALLRIATRCLKCRDTSAQVPFVDTTGGLLGGLKEACGAIGEIVNRLNPFASVGGLPGVSMHLAYASEVDALNWRTGCRDLSIVNLLRSNGFTCAASGLAQWADVVDPVASVIGADACIGHWGPQFPRQMRARGVSQVIASAVAAYRAMSVARTETQTFPYPVDTAGKLQMAYPRVSGCTPIGEVPLPGTMGASDDGAYGWIYWRRVTCCIPFGVVSQCL